MGSVLFVKDVRGEVQVFAHLADHVYGNAVNLARVWEKDDGEKFAKGWVGSQKAIRAALPFLCFAKPLAAASCCDFSEACVGESRAPVRAVSAWAIAARDSPPGS
jgi:hypothetical protein